MDIDTNFSDRFLDEISQDLNYQMIDRFKKSKPVQKWIKFYKDVFSFDVKLDANTFVVGDGLPGSKVFLVPKQLTIENCISLLRTQIDRFTSEVNNPDNELIFPRSKRGNYLLYRRYPRTLLDILVYELFCLYYDMPDSGDHLGRRFCYSQTDTNPKKSINIRGDIKSKTQRETWYEIRVSSY